MPARIVVVHDDASTLADLVNALSRAGYEVAGFSETMAALAAIEADERTAMLITRITFPEGMPHGVSLALMARVKKRGIQVLFLARPEMADQAAGVGEVLQTPVLAEDIVAKVRTMLPLSD